MGKCTEDRHLNTERLTCSHVPVSTVLTGAMWMLLAGVAICVTRPGFSRTESRLQGRVGRQKTKPAQTSTKQTILPPSGRPILSPAQEAAALNTEELQFVESLVREFPTSVDPIVLMGNVHGRHGNSTEAVRCWKKALEMNPRRADVYNGMGWFAMRKGESEEAISHWRKALEIDPHMPGLHNSIARALMVLGKRKEAIEELEKDIQVSPQSSLSYFLLGQEYLQQKEYEKAKKNYEVAIALQPDFRGAYYGLLTVCARLKQPTKAQEYMTMFKKLSDEDLTEQKRFLEGRNDALGDLVAMRKNVAETYMQAERIYQAHGHVQRTEGLLKRAATLAPENTACLMKLASLYQTSGRIPEALRMYKRISKIEPGDPASYLGIGTLSAKLRRFADAEAAFRQVIRLKPQSAHGYRSLAQLYLEANRKLPEARELAEKAVELEATAASYFVLSWACDKNGDTADALSAMKRAIELDPGNPKYRKMYELIQKRD